MPIIGRKHKEYDSLKFYLLAYAKFRFANEFLMDDEVRGLFFGLSTAQWISARIVAYYAAKKCGFLKKAVEC